MTATGAGAVSVTGQGNVSYGVFVQSNGSVIGTDGGNVTVNGTGNGAGVTSQFGGQIAAGGMGSVSVTGASSGPGMGVFVSNSEGITSAGGNVTIQGTTVGTSAYESGVYVTSAQISAGGTGSVSVTGASSGTGTGVQLTGFNSSTGTISAGGAVIVQGTSDTGSGVNVGILGIIAGGTNAPVTVSADSLNVASTGSISAGTGTVTLRPASADTVITLGGVDLPAQFPITLGLTDVELDRFTAGTLVIGRATAGNINLIAPITRSAGTAVQLVTGGNVISVGNGSLNTGGGSLALTVGGNVSPGRTGADFTASGVTFSAGTDLALSINGTTVDTGYRQLNVAGAVTLTGLDLALSGSYVPVPGDVFTLVSGTSVSGTFTGLANGSTVTLNGVPLLLTYTATTVTLSAFVV